MAYGTGMAYGFSAEVEAPLVGGLAGTGQVVATNLADALGYTGKAFVPSVWPTNGELINTSTGTTALGLVTLSALGHGRYLQVHSKTRAALLVYGIVTLAGGWLIPGLVRVLQGGVFRAAGRRGAGRYAYLPYPPVRADRGAARQGLADYGSGITSQANQQVLRRLFTAQ
jgi:hypothetical protein